MSKSYRLLIGSVGDDSHSVGMALLEIAFREAGYFVENLRILNSLDDLFYRAKDFDAIFYFLYQWALTSIYRRV